MPVVDIAVELTLDDRDVPGFPYRKTVTAEAVEPLEYSEPASGGIPTFLNVVRIIFAEYVSTTNADVKINNQTDGLVALQSGGFILLVGARLTVPLFVEFSHAASATIRAVTAGDRTNA